METLASDLVAPAIAETADVEDTNADAVVEPAKGEGSAPSGTEAATPGTPKRDKFQERIDQLTREKYDALRERDQRDYELERLRAQIKPQAQTEPVAPDQFPTLEQYGYDEGKFIAAVAAYNAKVAEEAVDKRLTAERERQDGERRLTTWKQKEAEFIKSKPDYVEKVQMARTLPITKEAQQALMESDLGPAVAMYLVENVEKAAAIMQLPIHAQLREIGRIEARLEAAKSAPKPPVSQAPAPVQKVDASNAQVEKSPSDMTDAEFAKWRKKQISARRNA